MRIIIGLVILIVFNSIANAKVHLFTLKELVTKSDEIIIGELEKIEYHFFKNDVAIIKPLKRIKSKTNETVIKIKIIKPIKRLAKKNKYLFFLVKDKNYYKILGSAQGFYHLKEDGFAYYGPEKNDLEKLLEEIEKYKVSP